MARSSGIHSLDFFLPDLTATGELPDLDNLSRWAGTSLEVPDGEFGFASFDGDGSVGAWLTPVIEAPTLGEADLAYPVSASWQADLAPSGTEVSLTLGDRIATGTPELDITGPGFGRAALDLEFAYEQIQFRNIEFAGFDIGGLSFFDSVETRTTLIEGTAVPPAFTVLPDGLVSGGAGIDIPTDVTWPWIVGGNNLGSFKVSLPTGARETVLGFDPEGDMDDPFGDVAGTASAPFATLDIDLDGLLSLLTPLPALEYDYSVPPDPDASARDPLPAAVQRQFDRIVDYLQSVAGLEKFAVALNLIDLEVSGDLEFGSRIEVDPSAVTARVFDAAGSLLAEGEVGETFTLPAPSDPDTTSVTYDIEYRLDGSFVQDFVLVPELEVPLKAGDFEVVVKTDLGIFNAILPTEYDETFGPVIDEDLLALAGFDVSFEVGLFGLDPLSFDEVFSEEELTLSRQITVSFGDGPRRTATTPIETVEGDRLGTLGLTLPTYATDGDAEYGLTLSTQDQGTQFNFAFIIDVSGSMSGTEIAEAKAAYLDLIEFLETEGIAAASQFAVIPFNGSANITAGLTSGEAEALISGLDAGGQTDFAPPLALAESFFLNAPAGATNVAYFLSDGRGEGASAALQALADVRAFGIGSAELDQLDIIDSNEAVLLSSTSDLAAAFQTSGFDADVIRQVELLRDGAVVATLGPDQFAETALGLTFDGRLDALPSGPGAVTGISARVRLDDGSVAGRVGLEITGGDGSGSAGPGDDVIALGLGARAVDAGAGNDRVTGNADANLIAGGPGNDTIESGDGDDTIVGTAGDDDRISGGPGTDTVRYADPIAAVGAPRRAGDLIEVGANTDVLDGVEYVAFADTRIATATLAPAPVLAVSASPGAEGGGPVQLAITASEPFAADATVALAVTGGDATPGADFAVPPAEVRFPAGATQATVELPVFADTLAEGRETVALELSAAAGASFGPTATTRAVTVGIADAGAPPTLFPVAATPRVEEPRDGSAAELVFEVRRTGDSSGAVSIGFSVEGSGPTPAGAADFAAPLPEGRLDFAAGETRREVRLEVLDDALIEPPSEAVTLRLAEPSPGATIAASAAQAVIAETDVFGPVDPPSGQIRGVPAGETLLAGAPARFASTGETDTFLVADTLPPATTATFLGRSGDTVALVPGLEIAGTAVAGGTIFLDLASGARVEILGAEDLSFATGTNPTTGASGATRDFPTFVEEVLGLAMPVEGVARGGFLTAPPATGTAPSEPPVETGATAGQFRALGGDETLVVSADTAYLGLAGADTYILSDALTPGAAATVIDAGGGRIELVEGLEMAASVLAGTTLRLSLASGAEVTILGAPEFDFAVAANATTGAMGDVLSYERFATEILGVTPPSATGGRVDGGPVTIGPPDTVSPVAAADVATTLAGTPVVVDVLTNDTDPQGAGTLDPASVRIVVGPTLGNVTSQADGTLTFDPAGAFDALAEGETAAATFAYTVADLDGNRSDPAAVTVTVEGRPEPDATLGIAAPGTYRGTDGVAEVFAIGVDDRTGQIASTFDGLAVIENFETGNTDPARDDRLVFENVAGSTVTLDDVTAIGNNRGLVIGANEIDRETVYSFAPNGRGDAAQLVVEGFTSPDEGVVDLI